MRNRTLLLVCLKVMRVLLTFICGFATYKRSGLRREELPLQPCFFGILLIYCNFDIGYPASKSFLLEKWSIHLLQLFLRDGDWMTQGFSKPLQLPLIELREATSPGLESSYDADSALRSGPMVKASKDIPYKSLHLYPTRSRK